MRKKEQEANVKRKAVARGEVDPEEEGAEAKKDENGEEIADEGDDKRATLGKRSNN